MNVIKNQIKPTTFDELYPGDVFRIVGRNSEIFMKTDEDAIVELTTGTLIMNELELRVKIKDDTEVILVSGAFIENYKE